MPRYLFNPSTGYVSAGEAVPVVLGGTGAMSASAAASSLGVVTTAMIAAANGVASLDGSTKLLVAQLPAGANGLCIGDGSGKVPASALPDGLGVAMDGPLIVYVGQVVPFTITNYSSFTTYTISTIGGTYSRSGATVTFTVTAAAGGACSITINGRVFTLTVVSSLVVVPSVSNITSGQTGVSLIPTFTSSAFAYLGTAQTQDNVSWELSTNVNFSSTVQSYTGASNLTSWTPTALSFNTVYYLRVKHRGTVGGWSEWSDGDQFTTAASYGWVVVLNSSPTYNEMFTDVASDSAGNIYAVGSNVIDGPTNGVQAILVKIDPSGNLTWQRKFGGTGNYTSNFQGVACDSAGNIYAVGYECRSTSSSSNYQAFITKWDTSGNLTWQKSLGGNLNDAFGKVKCDSSGNIVAVGYDFSTGGTYSDALITKWDSNGVLTWQKKLYGSYTDFIFNLDIDSAGNIYAVGCEYSSTSDTNNNQAILVKIDPSGNLTWQRKFGGTGNDYFYGVVCNGNIGVYAVGGEISDTGGTYSGALITKWDTSGNLTWQKRLGGYDTASSCIFYGVIIDKNNYVYAVGSDNTTPYSCSLITKWNSSGAVIWQKRMVGYGSSYFQGATIDSVGNIYAVASVPVSGFGATCTLTKWFSDSTLITDGNLTGASLTGLSIQTMNYSATTIALTAATSTLSFTSDSLSASTIALTAASMAASYYFSTY